MTVFTWKPASRPMPDPHSDEFKTSWAEPEPGCQLCGSKIVSGERVWHWGSVGGQDVLMHAECVKKSASGMILDIAECAR